MNTIIWKRQKPGHYMALVGKDKIVWGIWYEDDTDYHDHYTYKKWCVVRDSERMEYCCSTLKEAKQYAKDCIEEIERSNKLMALMRQP